MNGQQSATQPATWGQSQLDRSVGIRQAAVAAGVERLQKVAKMNRRLVRKMQNGTLGKDTVEPEDDEDDSVHVGDITINMPLDTPAPTPTPTPTPVPAPTPTPTPTPTPNKGLSKTAAAVLIAASLLGGAGAGVAFYSWLRPIPKFTDTDTNTQYNLRLWEPK